MDNTIDLAVWMLVVLARVLFFAIHIDGSDTHISGLGAGQCYLRATVFRTIHLDRRTPALVVLDALAHVFAEIFVEWIAGTIVLVEMFFKFVARCTVRLSVPAVRPTSPHCSQILDF